MTGSLGSSKALLDVKLPDLVIIDRIRVGRPPIIDKINKFMDKKFPPEIRLDELISEQIEKGIHTNDEKIHELLGEISDLDKSISPLIKQQQQMFNAYWGEVMHTGIEESYFAYQVDRFACVYTTKLGDLLEISPEPQNSWENSRDLA